MTRPKMTDEVRKLLEAFERDGRVVDKNKHRIGRSRIKFVKTEIKAGTRKLKSDWTVEVEYVQ
jgi:hypothetical protein